MGFWFYHDDILRLKNQHTPMQYENMSESRPVGAMGIEGAVYDEFTEDSPVKRSLKTLIFFFPFVDEDVLAYSSF